MSHSNLQRFLTALRVNDQKECLRLAVAEYQYACSRSRSKKNVSFLSRDQVSISSDTTDNGVSKRLIF
jgi:hypothetical protein